MIWHASNADKIISHLKTDKEKGLSEHTAAALLRRDGANELPHRKRTPLIIRFLEQFKDFMVIILLVAAVISFVTALIEDDGSYIDPIIILIIVVLNAVMGLVQESRAEKALEALKKMSAPSAKVIRGGKSNKIPAKDVVTGDIIQLDAGDLIPADARLISASSLKTRESALTGESLPSEKEAECILADNTSPADRKNMIFGGTLVASGHARAVVVATGSETQMGKIALLLGSESSPQTPLQLRLAKMGKILGFASIGICAVIFILGLLRGVKLLDSFMLSVSLAVAAVPEGLPAIVTIVLSVGVRRMAAKNAVIRSLPAVETLGAASYICSDKTGTLTQNMMSVTKLYSAICEMSPSTAEAKELLSSALLCCNCEIIQSKKGVSANGEPTENAIGIAAAEAGINQKELNVRLPRTHELPFDPSRKMMTVICGRTVPFKAVTKGAPDILVSRCSSVMLSGSAVPMSETMRASILSENEAMASDALRVIAVAVRSAASPSDAREDGLTFLGLIGMIDPPRREAAPAVRVCREAGIVPVMITGDHAVTAKAVAVNLGITTGQDRVITGKELDAMSDRERDAAIVGCRVFARVTPEHKVMIVKTLRAAGETVAMTGDGVNDAPALKAADIGCAMGRSGTEVAKGAADMILTDDNFATIVKAVEQGRGIYENIRRCVHFLISSNIGEILVILIASFMGMPPVIMPIQLLWVNLVTDSLPAMALGAERPDKDIMKKPPLKNGNRFFSEGAWISILLEGAMLGMLTLLAFLFGNRESPELGRTMAFATLSLSEICHAFNSRSEKSILKAGLLKNPKMLLAAAVCIVMQIAVTALPRLSYAFGTVPPDAVEWLVISALSAAPILIVEISKALGSTVKKNFTRKASIFHLFY